MGEIKSTLDLVLEKTKNLTLSSEEKAEQKQKEIENRIKGMMQKYQDGVLFSEQLKIDYQKLQNIMLKYHKIKRYLRNSRSFKMIVNLKNLVVPKR